LKASQLPHPHGLIAEGEKVDGVLGSHLLEQMIGSLVGSSVERIRYVGVND
jgi:hypothetical protein